MKGYRAYRDTVIKCRRGCRQQVASGGQEIFAGDGPELEFFERLTREALCLLECKKRETGGELPRGDEVASDVIDAFEKKKPYDYLQLCYFQVNKLPKQFPHCYEEG